MDIADVTCLGAKVANKLCPLRIQFNNLSHKRSAMGNAKKLCDSSTNFQNLHFHTVDHYNDILQVGLI